MSHWGRSSASCSNRGPAISEKAVSALVSLKCRPTQRLLKRDVAEHLSKQNCRLDRSEIGRPQTAKEAHCDIEITTPATLMIRVDVERTDRAEVRTASTYCRSNRAIRQSNRAVDDKFRASDAVKYGTIPAKFNGVPEQKPKYRRQTAQNTVGGSAVSRKDGGGSTMGKRLLTNSTTSSLFESS